MNISIENTVWIDDDCGPVLTQVKAPRFLNPNRAALLKSGKLLSKRSDQVETVLRFA